MIRSPRVLRPFTVTIIHKTEDENFIPAVIEHVAFDENYGIKQSNKGIADSDSVLLTIDLLDCGDNRFVDESKYEGKCGTFTIGNEDYFVLGCTDETDFETLKEKTNVYSITKFSKARPVGSTKVQFLEVYAS